MSVRTLCGCLLALAMGGVLVSILACRGGPDRVYPPKISASAAATEAINTFDTNKDGKIDGAELVKCPGMKAALAQVNKSGGDYVDYDMIRDRILAWQATKLGRMSLRCSVTHNGQPLANADVKFVPEAFLGPNMKVASGKTDENGNAMLSIPVDPNNRKDLPGVPPGFYRVEVTSPNMAIPDKYNANTVLGQEVALDAKGIQEGIRFEVDF
jgi:hypothetical protein